MVTEFPERGQQAPDYWDTQLKAYIDEQAAGAVTPQAVAATLDEEPVASDLRATIDAKVTDDVVDSTTDIGGAVGLLDLNATASRHRAGGRVHFHGSSIMHGDDNLSIFGPANSPPTHAMLASDGRWRHVGNSSVDGSTSTAQLASFVATVLPTDPDVVVLDPIPNDAASSFTTATTAANVAAMVKIARDNGIAVVIVNCPPQVTKLNETSRLNAWLQRYCAREGIPMVDWHGLLVDPATGNYRAGENIATNDVHPTYATRQSMGVALDAALRTIIAPVKGIVFDHKTDPRDILLGSGLFLGAANGSGSAGLTDNWVDWTGSEAARTWLTTTDAAVKGKKVRCTAISSTKSAQLGKDFTTGFSVGDKIEFSGLWNTPDVGPLQCSPEALIQFKNSVPATIGTEQHAFSFTSGMPAPVAWGTWARELTVPAGCVTIHVRLRFSTSNGTYISEFAQVGIRNLTTGGLVGV